MIDDIFHQSRKSIQNCFSAAFSKSLPLLRWRPFRGSPFCKRR